MLRRALPARPEARRILLGTLLSAIGRGLTLPFLFIYLTDVRGLTDTRAGLVIGWFGAVTLALSPVGGTLIDRFGARRVVLPCLLVEAVGTGSLALVDSAASAFAVATLIAVGGSALWSGQTTILASLTDDGERQRVFGLQFALLNLGIGVGGLISGAVVDTARPVTFQAIYLLDALSYLMPGLILLTLPHVGRRLAAAPTAGDRPSTGGYLTVLRDRPFRRLVIFGLVLTTCGYAQIEVGFTAYSVRVAEVTPRVVAWALAGNTVMIVLSQLLVIRRMEGRSRTGALAAVGAVFAAAWLVLGAAGVIRTGSALVAALGVVACAAIFGFGETMLSPVMPALTNALATDELRGRYNAMSSMIFGVSGIIGPVTAGPLIGAADGRIWVIVVVGGCLTASVLALSLRRLLTPAQDGRLTAAPTPARTPEPAAR
ncbi:MFS transporter [Micromonospora sp. 4G57]|uniref:MFS transporter n=1 Tax=Micromonospora sicca TaxID=2202420 RepID=A0ABU5JFK5_9ACTN|nr:MULTISPECIES: MFS transporter [unclassified Micromonospora]MDZ5441168.1 MFS transporter [Micromonospora sp. 4G57]MDZ5491394.1 MFS transporter [Micromonospora sp. 4G53]